MRLYQQVIAIYFGMVFFLVVIGGGVALAVKFKLSFTATIIAFGLLLVTLGIVLWKLVGES